MPDAMIIAVEPPDDAVTEHIHASLGAFNRAAADHSMRDFFHVTLRDAQGRLQGALIGSIRFDVLNIQDLLIEEAYRGGGHGARVIALAEAEAQRRGAKLASVNTFSWQARPFYEKQGYEVFAEITYLDGKHTLYWLRKKLCA